MSKIKIHKMIFQIQMKNPLYLDKTGAFIKATSELLDNWAGGIQGFKFTHINKRFSGRITSYDFAMSSEKISTLEEFEHCTLQVLSAIPNVYESPQVIRVGFRTFYMLRCSSAEAFTIIRNLFVSNLEEMVVPSGNLNGIESTFRFDFGESLYANLRLYYGQRSVIDEITYKEDKNEGLIIDIDYYCKVNDETLLTTEYVSQQIKPFFKKAKNTGKLIKSKILKVVSLHV